MEWPGKLATVFVGLLMIGLLLNGSLGNWSEGPAPFICFIELILFFIALSVAGGAALDGKSFVMEFSDVFIGASWYFLVAVVVFMGTGRLVQQFLR